MELYQFKLLENAMNVVNFIYGAGIVVKDIALTMNLNYNAIVRDHGFG